MSPVNDTFNYLAVLFSIIVGLAVAEILQGFKRLLIERHRTRLYLPGLVWGLTILLLLTQSWWAMFALRALRHWTFAMYAAVLVEALGFYMVAAVALADTYPEAEGRGDMRRAYYAHARPFFLLLVLAVGASLMKDLVVAGQLPAPANLAFHAVFAATALVGALTRAEWYHRCNAFLAAGLVCVYVAALFSRL
jgi:hypothetical protein